MKLTRPQMYVLLLGIVTIVIGLVTNIATNQIPDRFKPFLWLSGPLLVLLIIIFVVLTIKSSNDADSPPPFTELNLKAYFDALTKRYRTLDLDALTPPQREEYLQLQLRSVFVEQSVRENPPPIELPKELLEKLKSEGDLRVEDVPEGVSIEELRASSDRYYSRPPMPVIDVLSSPQNSHVVILGDPGSGKSTLARYIILSLVDTDGAPRLRNAFNDFLPLLVELRTFNALREERKCDTFLEFLEYLGKTEGWNLTEAALRDRLNTHGAVIIFDGLDEVFDPEDRERVSHSIIGFSQTYPKARIVVTSRIVGYQRKALTDGGFSHYTLQDLDRSQVESFVSRWYDLALADRPADANLRKKRILQSFDQSASVRQLAGNPMLLTIMAIIGKHQELPRERWKLYDHAASVLIEHWEVKRHLESLNVEAPFIGEEDKKELLRRLAHTMQAGSAGLKGNFIHRGQLQEEFQDYLESRFMLPLDRATTISRIMIDQFRQRNFILSLYGANVYGFVHRAFLEYFCATAFTYKFEKAREITIDQLAVDVFGAHWKDESWHEVLRLICGILDERFAGQLVTHLLRISRSPGHESQLTPANVELALRCLGEVRNLNLVAEATDLALEIVVASFSKLMADNSFSPDKTGFLRKLVEATSPIASHWPNPVKLVGLLKEFKPSGGAWMYEPQFGQFVALIGAGLNEVRDELIRFACSDDPGLRALWPEALTSQWKDYPRTIPLLKEQISNDAVDTCRRAATAAFCRHLSPTSENLLFMLERLQNESDGPARYEAVDYLAQTGDRSFIPVFNNYVSDDDFLVRYSAFMALSRYIEEEPAFSMILEKIPKEPELWLRRMFYEKLFELRGAEDGRIRKLLIERAVNDETVEGRIDLLEILARHFRRDPKIRNLIHARINDDPAPEVRDAAKRLVTGLMS